MTLEQIRARLAEIAALLEGNELQAAEGGYTTEQVEQIEALNTEFEGLQAQAETLEKVEAMKTKAQASAGRKTVAAAPAPTPRVTDMRQLNEKFGGFQSTGEFLMAVKESGRTGKMDERFIKAAVSKESVGEDGGFLVPEDIGSAILKKLDNPDESLLARCNVTNVSGNGLTLPVDESQPWNSGVQAYWMGEGKQFTDSSPSFKEVTWRLNKLGAMVKTTDELLEDAVALESYIKNAAPNAILHQINKAIINGNGVAKPQGLVNSPFAVTVAAESGPQTADTVVAANVIKMYSRMLPQSRAKGIWLINPAVEEQLRLAKDANDEYIYLSPGGVGGQLSGTPFGSLLGRPVMPMMGGMPALGDVGDIMFVDLSYYYAIRKAGIKSAQSIHLLFDKEQTAFRFSLRIDGKCPFTSPVTTEYGSYSMSGIVLLAAR